MRWRSGTRFGRLVVPLVCKIIATSSGVGGTSCAAARAPRTDAKASEDAGNTRGASEDARANPKLIGMNRVDCSRIQVTMSDGKVSTVTFLERPDAVLYPLAKAPPEELHMKGAEYRLAERPADRADIFRE